jgi:aryl-phospho-beta-D-glucosidase BglC (GH1 family)
MSQFLEYFFGEQDAKWFAEQGLNCIRLPVNYRHFEDDMNPRVFKKEGLKHLDRVIDIVSRPARIRVLGNELNSL